LPTPNSSSCDQGNVLCTIRNLFRATNSMELLPSRGAASWAATRGSLSVSRDQHAQCLVNKSSPHHPILFLTHPTSSTHRVFLLNGLFPFWPPTNNVYGFLTSRFMLPALPISSFLSWPFQLTWLLVIQRFPTSYHFISPPPRSSAQHLLPYYLTLVPPIILNFLTHRKL
jgi:hypothetical protein